MMTTKALSVILFAVAIAIFAPSFAKADENREVSGELTIGNGTVEQDSFFLNNSYYYAPVSLTLAINSITGLDNGESFLIQQTFQMLDTDRGISVIASSDPINGTQDTFNPVFIAQIFSPCEASFLINPTANLEFITTFESNVTATITYTYTLTIFNTSINIDQAQTVPTAPVQYFTYISPTFGLTTAFDVKIQLNSTSGANISSAFTFLAVGCPGVGGSFSRLYNLATFDAGQFAASIAGVKGAILFTLVTVGGELPDPDFLFQIGDAPDSSDDDDGLEGWQIALIVVGTVAGAVIVAAIVGAVVYLVVRKPGYDKL